MTIDDAGRVFTDPTAYADERASTPRAQLRRESPVHRVEADGFTPFWAVTRYDDVMEIERAARRVAQRAAAGARPEARDGTGRTDMPVRTLVQMDAPDHTVYRKHQRRSGSSRGNIARLADRAAELAKRSVDHMAELGGECDFFTDVAMHYPLYIILSLLGLPEEDFPRMLKLTQEMFGNDDPELGRGTDDDDADRDAARVLRVLPGAHRRPSRHPTRRSRVGDRERRGRRRADRRPRGGRLLRAHRHRRPRHHQLRDRWRAARAARAPRPAPAARRRPALVPTAVEEMIR